MIHLAWLTYASRDKDFERFLGAIWAEIKRPLQIYWQGVMGIGIGLMIGGAIYGVIL